MQAAQARKDAYVEVETLPDEPVLDRWSRRSRFLFIVGAAALCWALPGVAIYLLVAPY